jgi:hypothetical protein
MTHAFEPIYKITKHIHEVKPNHPMLEALLPVLHLMTKKIRSDLIVSAKNKRKQHNSLDFEPTAETSVENKSWLQF